MRAVSYGAGGTRTERRVPGEENEEELLIALRKWVAPEIVESLARAYRGSYWTFRGYLMSVYGTAAYEVLEGSAATAHKLGARYLADPVEVIMLPGVTGLDPRAEATAEWTRFLCHWNDMIPPNPEEVRLGRFSDPFRAYGRIEAMGVPWEYLNGFDLDRTSPYPLDEVIDAWTDGIPLEYARETIR